MVRTIRHQPRYDQDLKTICGTLERGDEIIRGLEWYIARMPERGLAVRGLDPDRYGSWVAHALGYSIQVVYAYGPEEVLCISARIVPSRTLG